MKGKETKTYRFESEVIHHAENNPLISSFAEWACDRYKKEFMTVETLSKKMQTYFDMANDCKDQLILLKQEIKDGSDINLLSPHELRWIQSEAQIRLKRGTFEGVYKFFVNTFNKSNINRRQFKLLCDRFSGGDS